MGRIINKEYEMTAELIRGFLEEMEFASFEELPAAKSIAKELKRGKFFEHGITSQQLGCTAENEQAIFVCFDEEKPLVERFKMAGGDPLDAGEPVECYLVVFVKTIEAKQKVDMLKAESSEWAKAWLANRKEGRKKSKIRFCTLHAPMREEKNFSIEIKSRIHALNYIPETEEEVKVASNVYVAKLFDIVNLYNQVGTELFERNVRYHIADILNVESEIQKTLKTHPEDFFNSNNGIAVQIRKHEDLDTRDECDIRLNYVERGDLSVINGAQTISAAAEFFFQQTEDKDTQRIIERAKRYAWVLLRVFYPEDEAQKDCGAVFDRISISLNRQKPINPMDIGYTCPAVMQINTLYEQNRNNPYYFKILKRGQEEHGGIKYQLADFGRMVTACYYNNPMTARSGSTQDIIRYNDSSDNSNESESVDKTIYAPFEDAAGQEDKEKLFMRWYRPINFANEIARVYSEVEKQYRKQENCDANVLAVLGNGRYFFVAYVVNALNDTDDGTSGGRSFENFHYDAARVKSEEASVAELVLQYAELAAQFAGEYLKTADPERNTLTSNDFKTQGFYKDWCEYTKSEQAALAWNEAMKETLNKDNGDKGAAPL